MGLEIDRNTVLNLIEEVEEFKSLHDEMDDTQLDMALANVIRCIRKPDVSPDIVRPLIVQIQALSSEMAFKASFYTTFGKNGERERHQKNVYYSARDALDKLADALKYLART